MLAVLQLSKELEMHDAGGIPLEQHTGPMPKRDGGLAGRPQESGDRRYWLPRHVHVCVTEDGVVFLDLRRDKYIGLGGRQMGALAALVQGWPVADSSSMGSETERDALAAADALSQRGLLTCDEQMGKSATPISLSSVDMITAADDAEARVLVRLGHVANFLIACASASMALRWRSLESVVNRVRVRKVNAASIASPDTETTRELAGVFRRLSSFAYTGKGRCLFHALALTNFLAHYGQFPTWVIGVRTNPFGAHSWVQNGSIIFDDLPERVCEYTPILAV